MGLLNFFREVKTEVDACIDNYITGHEREEELRKILEGGKRFRPVLCILSFKVCDGNEGDYRDALDIATAFEFGHCASLCHDDIIDGDLERRDDTAFWACEGVPEALLVGHLAISMGLNISISHGSNITKTLLDTWKRSTKGNLKEIELRKKQNIAPATYLNVNEEKTGRVFAGASKAGAQLARAGPEIEGIMEEYGMVVGRAYQIADDISDYSDDVLEISNSLEGREGRSSLKNFLVDNIEGSFKQAKELSRNKKLPESEFKDYMNQVPRYFARMTLEGKLSKKIT